VKFNQIVLGDYIDVLTDYHANGAYEKLKANVTLKHDPDYAIMIRTLNFEAGNFDSKLIYINKDEYKFLSKSKVYSNDIIMNKIANAGSVYIMPELNRPVSLAMNLFLIRFNDLLDKRFMYYLMHLYEPYIKQYANGTATLTITKDSVKGLKFYVPPLPTQQKIAKILSNYDDLIENNLKRIKLLEESARLTYEEWFLRFRVDGKRLEINPESGLPFEWQDVLLTDYIDLLRGVEPGSSKYEEVKTDSNIPFIRVGNLSKRDSNIYVSKDLANNKIIDKDDIILSLDGSPGMVKFGLSGCYSTGVRKAVSKQENISSIFIYNLLNSPYIQGLIEAYATGATILHAGSSVKKMRVILPTDEVLDKYNNIEMKKFQLILNLSDENKLLKEARDILLPRLMTGMIDTDDLDIAV